MILLRCAFDITLTNVNSVESYINQQKLIIRTALFSTKYTYQILTCIYCIEEMVYCICNDTTERAQTMGMSSLRTIQKFVTKKHVRWMNAVHAVHVCVIREYCISLCLHKLPAR